jgi:hypothetical protein
MEKYTTDKIRDKILDSKDISVDDKDVEAAKIVISDDAFAVCDLIEQLIKKAEHLRISSLMRR